MSAKIAIVVGVVGIGALLAFTAYAGTPPRFVAIKGAKPIAVTGKSGTAYSVRRVGTIMGTASVWEVSDPEGAVIVYRQEGSDMDRRFLELFEGLAGTGARVDRAMSDFGVQR